MKLLATLICGAALLAGLRPAFAQSAPATALPRFTLLGTNAVTLGKLSTFEERRVTFRFKNTGAVSVTILSLLPNCSCVRGAADKLRVPPGEEAVVTLALDPQKVRGTFTHGVWVVVDDPVLKRACLSVSGEVEPLFAGFPDAPLSLVADAPKVVWTNRYTLTATRPGVRLGAPQTESDAAVHAVVTLVTNASDRASYDLTLVLTPLARGRHRTSVSLPVEGLSNAPPERLDVLTRVGKALAVSPEQINLYASGTPLTRRFLVRTDEAAVNADALTWEPKIEGLEVSFKPTKRADNLLVTVQFSPKAIRRLLAERNANLLFHYPKHVSASVRIAAAGPASPSGGN